MLVKKFEQQAKKFQERLAIKTPIRSVTYHQLNEYSTRLGNTLSRQGEKLSDKPGSQVALLFEHGIDMIIAILSALKANQVYIPMDATYPKKRLLYMLEHSESYIILTNSKNQNLAEKLKEMSSAKILIINIDSIIEDESLDGNLLEINHDQQGEQLAYFLYTSGSTGKPKGVLQNQENILYFIEGWIERFSITENDRLTLFSSFSHDASIPDLFSGLLMGATLYPYNFKEHANLRDIKTLLREEKITVWHSVASLYRTFTSSLSEGEEYQDLRYVILGGEQVRGSDFAKFVKHFPNGKFSNIYGQTESTVNSICILSKKDNVPMLTLGKPLDQTTLLLIGESGEEAGELGMGEIVVASNHVALGYWQDEEQTGYVFTDDVEMGKLYWTGDIGRYTPEGEIKIMGRKDNQIKIRGFRVELGEIETQLVNHKSVKEAVVNHRKDDRGDICLYAYLVPASGQDISGEQLRDYLTSYLPDYMVPKQIIQIDEIPLTPNGKVDHQALPDPEKEKNLKLDFEPPSNDTEKKLVEIWKEVFCQETVGINHDFIDLGGHSLLLISMISKIHQEFSVELQLQQVLRNPTIKELARLIKDSEMTVFSSIKPTEEKEQYPANLDQMRMFVLNRFEGIGVTYNLPRVTVLSGDFDELRFRKVFKELARNHDCFRTSFRLINGEVFQEIRKEMDFPIEYKELPDELKQLKTEEITRIMTSQFIKPFDLEKAPLIRVQLVKLSETEHLFLLDLHHIISDGISQEILIREFCRFYGGEELSPLKLQYKDYSEWENYLIKSGKLHQQEEYWLDRFKGEIPVLDLPISFPRPKVRGYEGGVLYFPLEKEIKTQLNELVRETNTTLYTLLLALYTLLLSKYSGQEDIVVGSVVAGRNHVDLESIIGLVVKTLAIRNYPSSEKTFEAFLMEVMENSILAFENQQYPFMKLVDKLELKKDLGRNPLFDAAFIFQNASQSQVSKKERLADTGLLLNLPFFEFHVSKFDITFEAAETGMEIICVFEYRADLFKPETMELMKERFLVLINSVIANKDSQLKDLEYQLEEEKKLSSVKDVEFDF
jgi:amino acid adenylation domain-containing protein